MIQETAVKIVTRMTELSVDDVKISKPETLGLGKVVYRYVMPTA